MKDLDTNLADGDSDLKDLYAALERAIVLQRQALEGTQNLSVNIDDVWLDVNRVKREDKDIQAALDAYREKILDLQVNVRETLIKGVQLAPDQGIHLARSHAEYRPDGGCGSQSSRVCRGTYTA